jgi:hypothetical protein
LIETANSKHPNEKELGSMEGIKEKGTSKDGHISRNIRICLTLLDITTPYIWFFSYFYLYQK